MKYIGFPIRFALCFGVFAPALILCKVVTLLFGGYWPGNGLCLRDLWEHSLNGF